MASTHTIQLAISPCPNDTFIFDALINQKIDTQGVEFTPVFADAETLNQAALKRTYPLTKLSYHAFAFVKDKYNLLASGGALGEDCGPILISLLKYSRWDVRFLKIAIPGKLTTANFLLQYYQPKGKVCLPYVFSKIEDAILFNSVDAGVIIHENRFTFKEKGLMEVQDLGTYWEENTGLPIPLGGIVIDKNLPRKTQQAIGQLVRESVAYALANPNGTLPFVKQYAQEMEDDVMLKHIKTFVNHYSIDLGPKGEKAAKKMLETLKISPDFEVIR